MLPHVACSVVHYLDETCRSFLEPFGAVVLGQLLQHVALAGSAVNARDLLEHEWSRTWTGWRTLSERLAHISTSFEHDTAYS